MTPDILAAAQRIIAYWKARGIVSPDQCKTRNLDELRVALFAERLRAPRDEVIEECAKVCDDYERDGELRREYAHETADELAARIRALKSPPQREKEDELESAEDNELAQPKKASPV